MEISIQPATIADIEKITDTIAAALHIEADPAENENWRLWRGIFRAMTAAEVSQYSYRNTLKAVTPDGEIAGMIVSYDGADYHRLREPFYDEVKRRTGEDIRYFAEETDPGEWYIDSLHVMPEFRRRGIARRLIEAVVARAGKPVGLLVDPANPDARRLYESLGFREIGIRPFGDIPMHHLLLRP